MKSIRSAVLLGLLLAAGARAQTTGVPGMNDYTINGLTSGSSSCTQLCFASPLTLNMVVSGPPNSAAMIFWTDCPCRGCAIPWPANPCVPAIPFGTLLPCAATNQSLDFLPIPGCQVLFSAFVLTNTAGVAAVSLNVPLIGNSAQPCSLRFSTQAAVIDPCGVGGPPIGPGPFVLTQAYDVGF